MPVTVVPLDAHKLLEHAPQGDWQAKKLACSMPLLENIFTTHFAAFQHDNTEQMCFDEAGLDVSNENLGISELRGSIACSKEALSHISTHRGEMRKPKPARDKEMTLMQDKRRTLCDRRTKTIRTT